MIGRRIKSFRRFLAGQRPPDDAFSVEAPWQIGKHDAFRVSFKTENPSRLGGHFLRFDVYPLHAPLHQVRHQGYWDVPVKHLRQKACQFTFSGDVLQLHTVDGLRSFKPAWRSGLPLRGYAMVHISLWDGLDHPPRQIVLRSSLHLFYQPGDDLSLDFAYFSLTHRCNLSCSMCMRHNTKSGHDGDVEPNVLAPFLETVPDLKHIFLGGIGEILLWKGLAELVRSIKSKIPAAGQVTMNTNGMLLNGDAAAGLIDAGVNGICFSIDGARKETVEKIRTGLHYDTLMTNVAATVAVRERSGRKDCWLATNYVVQESNIDEVIPFVEMMASMGLDAVHINHRRNFKKGTFLLIEEKKLADVFSAAKAIGERTGIAVSLPALRPAAEFQCRFLQGVYILLDGEVVPCCRMLPGAYPGKKVSFGNISERPLAEIWSSPAYRAFRRGTFSGDYPEVCRGCPYATGLLT